MPTSISPFPLPNTRPFGYTERACSKLFGIDKFWSKTISEARKWEEPSYIAIFTRRKRVPKWLMLAAKKSPLANADSASSSSQSIPSLKSLTKALHIQPIYVYIRPYKHFLELICVRIRASPRPGADTCSFFSDSMHLVWYLGQIKSCVTSVLGPMRNCWKAV